MIIIFCNLTVVNIFFIYFFFVFKNIKTKLFLNFIELQTDKYKIL